MTAAVTAERAAPPSSVEELLARSGQTALDLSGAGQSAWNDQVIETTGNVLGLAHWDGTLYLDSECILDPLRDMYEHAGEEQPVATLVRYRESLATLLHEQVHFLGPSGATQEAARGAFTQPGSRQLEEGVAEAWAQDHLDEFLDRLGIDKVAPGIQDVQVGGYYPAFVPAIRVLTADLEARGDLRSGELLDALNRQTAEGQLPLLVSVLYNSTRLPDLEPAGADTRHHLEAMLREGLTHLDSHELLPSGFAAARSRSTAGALLTHLHTEIHARESDYSPHPSACDLPAPAPVPQSPTTTARLIPHPMHTALTGLAPPSPHRPPTVVHTPAQRIPSVVRTSAPHRRQSVG
jgi:hypothetical protein